MKFCKIGSYENHYINVLPYLLAYKARGVCEGSEETFSWTHL